jgi:hypothetical protein
MTDESQICQVCISEYTATKRKPIACPGCQYSVCTACVRNYLLTTVAAPHCLQCRMAWNRSFLYDQLPKSFVDGDLKEHRYKAIFDREKSLMPATQEYVQYELEARRRNTENEELHKQEQELKHQLNLLQMRKELNKQYIFQVASGNAPTANPDGATEAQERRAFIAACPAEDCRGFLSTAYKCGTCSKQFCSKCREPKHAEEEHTCDPDLVATVAAIVKDSRGCPSCGIPISKVHGCDQMFCTQCNTAFSYNTGKIQTGPIHNPHYFERLQQLGTALMDQARQQGDAACGRWPNYYDFRQLLQNHGMYAQMEEIVFILQTGIHVEQVELPRYPAITADEHQSAFRKLRVKYLLHEITEREFSMTVQRMERTAEKSAEIREVLELYVITTMEFLVNVRRNIQEKKNDKVKQIEKLHRNYWKFITDFTNTALREIGDRYQNQIAQILTRNEVNEYNKTKGKNTYAWRQVNGFVHNHYKPKKEKKEKKGKDTDSDNGSTIEHV